MTPTMQRKSLNEEKLEKRLALASDTIGFLNSAIGAIGVLLAVLGLFLYFVVVKPSQDLIEKVEETLDKRITLYLEKQQNQQIESAIDSLESPRAIRRRLAISVLSNKAGTIELDDSKLLRIIQILRNQSTDDQEILNLILFQGKREVLDNFFQLIVEKGNAQSDRFLWSAYLYFLRYGNAEDINKFAPPFATYSDKEQEILYLDWLEAAATSDQRNFFNLLWSKVLVDTLVDSMEHDPKIIKDRALQIGKDYLIPEARITETYFYQQVSALRNKD